MSFQGGRGGTTAGSRAAICLQPGEVVEAAGLIPQHDYIAWRFESGEIRGRKQSPAPDHTGRVARDRKTGLLFWDGDISAEEAENAALSANLDRE